MVVAYNMQWSKVAGRQLRCMHVHFVCSYVAWSSSVKFSVFTYNCSDKITRNKCKTYAILKLFPNINNVGINLRFPNKHDSRTDSIYSQTMNFWKTFSDSKLQSLVTKPVWLFDFLFSPKPLPRKSHSFLSVLSR